MNINLQIIEKIIFSKKDEKVFKNINFDKEKIKNINYDFDNIVVNKPWGFEYRVYSSKDVSVWILKIKKDKKTSLHCHTNKKTSLILLDGEANIFTLNKKIHLKCGNAVTIDKGVFHRTSSDYGKDILVMEIETPTNKNDIVRFEDEYKRSNSGYESKESFSEVKDLDIFLNYNNIKNNSGILGDCEIKIINNFSEKIKLLNEKTLICPIKLESKNNKNKIKLGEIYEKNFIKERDTLSIDLEEFLVIQKKQSK